VLIHIDSSFCLAIVYYSHSILQTFLSRHMSAREALQGGGKNGRGSGARGVSNSPVIGGVQCCKTGMLEEWNKGRNDGIMEAKTEGWNGGRMG
jgi:hypothetical protein